MATLQAIVVGLICIASGMQTACTSFENKVNTWIGNPISDRIRLNSARIEKLANATSNEESVYLEEWDKGCRVFWQVNSGGIITSWRSEGSACKYYTN